MNQWNMARLSHRLSLEWGMNIKNKPIKSLKRKLFLV
jgi:hypothetical protein